MRDSWPSPLIPTFYVVFPVICYPLLSVILIANIANKSPVNNTLLTITLLTNDLPTNPLSSITSYQIEPMRVKSVIKCINRLSSAILCYLPFS